MEIYFLLLRILLLYFRFRSIFFSIFYFKANIFFFFFLQHIFIEFFLFALILYPPLYTVRILLLSYFVRIYRIVYFFLTFYLCYLIIGHDIFTTLISALKFSVISTSRDLYTLKNRFLITSLATTTILIKKTKRGKGRHVSTFHNRAPFRNVLSNRRVAAIGLTVF